MDTMLEVIRGFSGQLLNEPRIENSDSLPTVEKYIVVGMGGSGLAADLLKTWNPRLQLIIHQDYGLPTYVSEKDLQESLIIASSYSGNTEEVLVAFDEATKRGLRIAVITVGGKLLELARTHKVPYVQIPDTGIQPRSARGFSFLAFLKLMGQEQAIRDTRKIASELPVAQYEDEGRRIADLIKGKMPIIYSSRENKSIAYNWKVVFNETGKIPAFYNVFPELNHNEMAGFDEKSFSEHFHCIFLKDSSDSPRIQKRMDLLQKLYRDRSLPVEVVDIHHDNVLNRLFAALMIADFAAYYTAVSYNLDPEKMKIVEEFKKML